MSTFSNAGEIKISQENPIPFNKPYLTGKELINISEAYQRGQLAGDGHFTKLCSIWLEKKIGCHRALLTHSCTAALEMAAIIANIGPGDEVILPSYTFVSTANAFVLRGAKPVFVDIRQDTLNIDETQIESAITSKTKAIVPVHYAGVACEMDTIMKIANTHNLLVIEDAAQGVMATYKGRKLGSIGHLGCLSFHETKNIISGEGGALLINSSEYVERAEIVREKGTNRSKFFRGQVDKYNWVDIGSSYLPGEIIAAFLYAQMQDADNITIKRISIWNKYNQDSTFKEIREYISIPSIPSECGHNAHMYYLLLKNLEERTDFILWMKEKNINCVFHYIPLHSSPQGLIHGKTIGNLPITTNSADRLVRLPMWIGVEEYQGYIIDSIGSFFHKNKSNLQRK